MLGLRPVEYQPKHHSELPIAQRHQGDLEPLYHPEVANEAEISDCFEIYAAESTSRNPVEKTPFEDRCRRGRVPSICLSKVAMSCSFTLVKLWVPPRARESVDGAVTSFQSQIIGIEFDTTSPSHRDFWTSCRLLIVPHIRRYSSLSPKTSPHPALLTHSFRDLQRFTHRGPSLMWFSSIM